LKNRENILIVLFTISFIGLYFSKTVLSIFPYLLLIYGFSHKGSLNRLVSFFKKPSIFSIFLIFFTYVLSGINSYNSSMWLTRLNTNLIYMIIPLGVYLSGPYNKSLINKIIASFSIINSLISLLLLYNYFMDYSHVNEIYLRGQTIKTPIIHVRYSYFVALSVTFSAYLYFTNFYIKYKLEKYLYGFMSIFLLIFIHLMAVRTGILSLYLTLLISVFFFSNKINKLKLGVSILGLLIGLMILSYNVFPSFKNKIEYVKWDIRSTLDGTAKYHTSDRIRINSIINGFKILKDNPLMGSGIGDIEYEMNKKYNINYPDLPQNLRFQPINQFVFILASMGLLGFILFFGLLLFPLFQIKQKHKLLFLLYTLTFLTFMGETTIELIVGKTAFLTLLSVLICYKEKELEY